MTELTALPGLETGSWRGVASPDGPRQFHAAICGACGGQAVVPFAPRNDRPVYCSTCFDKVRDGTLNVSASV